MSFLGVNLYLSASRGMAARGGRRIPPHAVSHNILEFCARVPARKAELGPGSLSESRAGTATRCLLGCRLPQFSVNLAEKAWRCLNARSGRPLARVSRRELSVHMHQGFAARAHRLGDGCNRLA